MARGHAFRAIQRQVRAAAVWSAAVGAVQVSLGMPVPAQPGALRGGRRHSRSEVELRKLALYTAVCGLGCSASSVARAAGFARRWVDEVVAALEADREAAEVDDLLTRLERQARELMDAPADQAVAA